MWKPRQVWTLVPSKDAVQTLDSPTLFLLSCAGSIKSWTLRDSVPLGSFEINEIDTQDLQ